MKNHPCSFKGKSHPPYESELPKKYSRAIMAFFQLQKIVNILYFPQFISAI